MAERWQQWMPFHIDRFRGSPDVRAMHPAAQMGYLYLLASAWQTDDCTISSDELDLASDSCLGDELWAMYRVRILRKFEAVPGNDRLRNPVLYEEWRDAKRIFDARVASARKTTQVRSPKKSSTVTVKDYNDHQTMIGTITPRRADTITGTGTGTKTTTKDACTEETKKPVFSVLDAVNGELPMGCLPLNDGRGWRPASELVDRWQALYPGVDVRQCLRSMRAWLDASAKRRKTKSGIQKFIVAWLEREQNSNRTGGHDGKRTNAAGGYRGKSEGTIDAAHEYLAGEIAKYRQPGVSSPQDMDYSPAIADGGTASGPKVIEG